MEFLTIPETYLYLSYGCDLGKHQNSLVFLLHLALFRLVGLSERNIIELLPLLLQDFLLLSSLHIRFRNAFTVTVQKQITHGKSNSLTAKANQVRMRRCFARYC